MNKRERMAYIRLNADKSVKEIADTLGIADRTVRELAKTAGVILKGQRINGDRSFCDPPFSCGDCPYPDCINSQACTADETAFVENALGQRKIGLKKVIET